jgi:hypothetical protein
MFYRIRSDRESSLVSWSEPSFLLNIFVVTAAPIDPLPDQPILALLLAQAGSTNPPHFARNRSHRLSRGLK